MSLNKLSFPTEVKYHILKFHKGKCINTVVLVLLEFYPLICKIIGNMPKNRAKHELK